MSRRLTSLTVFALLSSAVVAVLGPSAPAVASPSCPALCRDYNGDGREDVIAGEQYRDVNGLSDAGAVRVLYGSTSGLSGSSAQLFTEESAAVPGLAQANAHWGFSVVSANFNGDAWADVAIGGPSHDNAKGRVVVLYGSASGLHATPAAQAMAELITPGVFIADPGAIPYFGWSLGVADLNADGRADLVIGAPGVSGASGGIVILYGTQDGLLGPNQQSYWFSQAMMPGGAHLGDWFGGAIGAGDFDGDGRDDLVVGAYSSTINGFPKAGQFYILPTNASGLPARNLFRVVSQETPGVPDTAEEQDFYGGGFATGDLNGDGREDLIVSAGEDAFAAPLDKGGLVTVFYGSSSGLLIGNGQLLQVGAYAGFGADVEIADLNLDGFADAAIGASYQIVDGKFMAGALFVYFGSALGLVNNPQMWSQATAGVPGDPESPAQFARGLQFIRTTSGPYPDLVVGIPKADAGVLTDAGAIMVLRGGAGGLTTTGATLFLASNLPGGAQSNAWLGFEVE